MNQIQFYTRLVQEFPQLENLIEIGEGNVFMNMEEFADYANFLIKVGNRTELLRCFKFIEDNLGSINAILENAVNVSFNEALLLGENSKEMGKIVAFMPANLQKMYKDYENYYDNLVKKNTNS